jgi:hypothetical protein
MCGAYQMMRLLVSDCSSKKWSSFVDIYYLEASKATWRSPVYDHFDITLRREMDVRGRPKALFFVFTCKVDPAHHPVHIRARMSTGHGTKNIQDRVKACDKHVGTVTSTTAVKSGQPYSTAAHRTLIAMRCAKNHRPFNSILDEDYQAEVEMLHPGTVLPSPQTVSRDIKSIYAEMSKNVRNYFMVTFNLFHGYNSHYINTNTNRLLTPPFIWSWMDGQRPLLHLFLELLLCGFQTVSFIVLFLNLYS